ncbi:MAG: FtsH protease activity modulator HflK [Myxococcales bacterium]|jgi:membrane protease subunit HflK
MSLDRRIRASLVSISADLVLIGTKAALAKLTGSLALAADAMHSLSDLAVSAVVLLGIGLRRRSEKKGEPMARFRRLEAGIAYAVSLLILYAPYEIVTTLLRRPPQPLAQLPLAVVGLLVCIAIAYFISRLKLMVGSETGSPALTADGYHSRMDMLSSIAVLFAVMGDAIGIRLDPIVAAVIALLIGVTGVELFVSSVRALFAGSELKTDALDGWLHAKLGKLLGSRAPSDGAPREVLPWIASLRRLGGRRALSGGAAGALVLWAFSGTTLVRPGEIGVRTRFGAIVDARLEPGLHYRLPWPIETIKKTRPESIERVEVGFRVIEKAPAADQATGQPPGQRTGILKVREEAMVLSGDESLVDLNLVVHYRPRDPIAALYRAKEVSQIVRGLTESLVREVLATVPVDNVLTSERPKIMRALEEQLRREADGLELGIEVVSVLLRDAHPPAEVVSAFRDVFSAREDQLKLLEQAEAHRNQALPAARAGSAARIAEAQAYEVDKRLRATGDAQRFLLGAKAYRSAPAVTGYRLFIETAEAGLAGKKKIIANPEANRGGYHLWLFAPDNLPTSTAPLRPTPRPPMPRSLPPQENEG